MEGDPKSNLNVLTCKQPELFICLMVTKHKKKCKVKQLSEFHCPIKIITTKIKAKFESIL